MAVMGLINTRKCPAFGASYSLRYLHNLLLLLQVFIQMSLNYPIYIYPFYMDKAKRVMTEIVDQANQMYLCFFQV